MSRSRKKPILKDSFRRVKKATMYWRPIRSRLKNELRSGAEELPNPKSIINDYTRCDRVYRAYTKEQEVKWSRK